VRTVAFINKRAISAGALISLATEKIAMAEGGTIGAATPVAMGQPGAPAQPVAEKTVSYMRKEFRATAEARKRPPLLAEAMVDADVDIPGVIDKGKLLTLTTDEALQHQVADVRANRVEGVLEFLELSGADMRLASQTWAETLVRFLTYPVVSSLLLTIGMLGLIVELRTPGLGVPGILGVTSLALFFWRPWPCSASCRACRWADASSWRRRWRRTRAMPRRPRAIVAGLASVARRHPPCGRPDWPTSRASAWMWCLTGSSLTPESPLR
jgi:membrane-bound serine protease (ClpP class)